MKVIVYTSNTGSTERYAQMLSEKTGYPCEKLEKADFDENDEVIFLGWVMTGDLQGYKAAKEKYKNIIAVGAVGMMKSDKSLDEIKQKSGVTEPLYFLMGAFDMKKLKGIYKIMMGMMVKMLKSKVKESGQPEMGKAVELFEKGFDEVKEENLEALFEAVK